MSWDLIAFAADTLLYTGEDGVARFPDSWMPADIGVSRDVRKKISEVYAETDWSDPAWGVFVNDSYSFEFSIGTEDAINTFSIHARGEATAAVVRLIDATGWKMLDVSTMRWLNNSPDPDEGRRKFQSYLDTVIDAQSKSNKRGLLSYVFGQWK